AHAGGAGDHPPRALCRTDRQGRRAARLARDDRALSRRGDPPARRQRPRAVGLRDPPAVGARPAGTRMINSAARAWVRDALQRIEADTRRSADTHLVPLTLPEAP